MDDIYLWRSSICPKLTTSHCDLLHACKLCRVGLTVTDLQPGCDKVAFEQGYSPPNELASEYQMIMLSKIKKYGMHAKHSTAWF